MKKLIPLLFSIFLFSCNEKKVVDNELYDKAYELIASNKDSSFVYFNRAKDVFLQKGEFSYVGNCLVNMAIIQCDYGDYYGSRESGLSAIKYLDKKRDSLDIVANYNNLGIACQYLKDYRRAAEFYDKAADFSSSTAKLTLLNNKAVSYIYLKKYDSAISVFNELLNSGDISKEEILFSRVHDNLAYTKFLKNPNYDAEKELKEAVSIRIKIKDDMGLNASYFHLTEYFENKNPEKALYYAKENLKVAKINNSPDDQLQALENIILLENPKNSINYFLNYQRINDSLNTARNKSKNQFALERYDSEQLKAKNAENEFDILLRNVILVALILFLTYGIFWYRKRKRRHQQEKELEVKNTQLKLSKRVHDVVANGLYHIMVDVENNPEINKERILNDIEKMYEESRDISHETYNEKDFSLRFDSMISSYSSPDQKVVKIGYKDVFWQGVPYNMQLELYYIIRELLVNMKKHSQAKLVSLRFEKNEKLLKIRYTDNGVGINKGEIRKGVGINSTENRIDSIGGDIIFEENPSGGLIIQIIIPLNSKYV